MAFINEYQRFLSSDKVDDTTKNELYAIRNQEDEIKERFSAPLSFGTAGLRGILRAGLNGMNIYTVRHATQALCEVISDAGSDAMARGVVIAYDSRIMSSEFAKEAAGVIAANKIKVYLFDELRPTPELSFAIRQLHAIAGINVTASHNPKEYNGYKVYWEDGGQLPPEHAQMVSDRMNSIDIFDGIKHVSFETGIKAGFISIIGREIDEEYIKNVLAQAVNPEAVKKAADSFKVVYTPFHGSGYKIVPEVLRRAGMKHILMVKEQEKPDGNFPTVKSPNPEDKEGFSFAVALAKQNDIDLLIGTDPDADRVGILVRDKENGYIPLTGNQVGCILIDYILWKGKIAFRKMPPSLKVL